MFRTIVRIYLEYNIFTVLDLKKDIKLLDIKLEYLIENII